MSSTKTIVVTGANRGIGRAICELILSQSSSAPLALYATSRSGDDLGLQTSQGSKAIYHKLDIGKPSSVKTLLSTIQSNNHLPVSVLINNAGINLDDDFNSSNVKNTLDTNYRGTLSVIQAFLPHMAENSRIVSLSSTGSSLNPYSKEKAQQFRNVSSLEELESFMTEFQSAVDKGTYVEDGWPERRSYSVSKGAVNSFTGILAKQNPNVTINCCCPGWVNTEMGGLTGNAPKQPIDGAKIPVRLALGDVQGVSGKYWANDSVSSKADGKVQAW